MEIRKATPQELDQIYEMGFDVWSEGKTRDEYLASCRISNKYKKGQWFVLSNDSDLLSSLIVYEFANQVFGIGSIATPPKSRNKGYASKLISSVISGIEKNQPNAAIFLYSDINPDFYERFDFVRICARRGNSNSTCMVRASNSKQIAKESIPSYF